MHENSNRSRVLWPLLLASFGIVAFLATIGIGTSVSLFARWSEVKPATSEEATTSFDEELTRMKDPRPYLVISESGTFEVQRELEARDSDNVTALNVMAYEPSESRLWHGRIPFWFVKLKSTDFTNLGTLVAVLLKDWERLDLDVTQDDLMHRGPGLVLDHTNEAGERILVWSE